MKKKYILAATSIILGASMISQTSFARGFEFNKQNSSPLHHKSIQQDDESSRVLRLARVLGLTDEQVTNIQTILDTNEEQKLTTKALIEESRNALREQALAGVYDESSVQELADLISSIVILKHKERFDIAQILTDEQKEKLEQMQQFFENKRGNSSFGNSRLVES